MLYCSRCAERRAQATFSDFASGETHAPLPLRFRLASLLTLLVLLCLTPPCVFATPQPVGFAGGNVLWNNSDGNGAVSLAVYVSSTSTYSYYTYGPYPGWSARALAAGSDKVPRILWNKTDGSAALWRVDASGGVTQTTYGPYPGWTARGLAVGINNVPRIMWTSTSGQMSLWSVDAQGGFTFQNFGPYSIYTASLMAVDGNNNPRILWNKTDGSISLWDGLDGAAGYSHTEYGPFPGYTPLSISVDANSYFHLLWNHPSDSTVSLWTQPSGRIYTYENYTNPANSVPTTLNSGVYENVSMLYAQADGTALVRSDISGGAFMYTVAPPGASNGGGNGTGSGGGASYGHYDVSYSGGTMTTQDASGAHTAYPTSSSYGYDGSTRVQGEFSSSTSLYISAKIQGPITTTFRWVADPGTNSPPPAQATVTENCSFNWQLYDPGGGSKTFSVNTGGLSSFSVSSNPLGSLAGYLKNGCGYETLGFHFTAAAAVPNVSLKVDQDLQIFPPAATTRFSATVRGPSSVVLDSMKISVDGNAPVTATLIAGTLTSYIDWPSSSAANPSEHTVTATALAHDGATSLTLDSTKPEGNGRVADNIIADLRLKSLTFSSASGSQAPLTLRVRADSSPGNNDGVVAAPQVLWDVASTGLPYNPTQTNPAGYIMGSKPQFTFAISKPNGADPEVGATVGLTLSASAHPNTGDADIVLKDTQGQPVAVSLPTANLPSDNPLLNKIAAYPVSITDLGIWLKFTKPATPVWVRHRSYAASSGANIQQFGTTFYTVLASPTAPMTQPWTEVLDKACVWASGKSDATNATIALCNGFYANSYYNPGNRAWYTEGSPEIFHLNNFLHKTAGVSPAPSGLQGQCNDFSDFLVCLSAAVGAKPVQSQRSNGGFYYSHVIYAGTTTSHTPMPDYFNYHQWTTDGTASAGNIFDSAVRPDNAATAIPVNEALNPYLNWLSPSPPLYALPPFMPTIVN